MYGMHTVLKGSVVYARGRGSKIGSGFIIITNMEPSPSQPSDDNTVHDVLDVSIRSLWDHGFTEMVACTGVDGTTYMRHQRLDPDDHIDQVREYIQILVWASKMLSKDEVRIIIPLWTDRLISPQHKDWASLWG